MPMNCQLEGLTVVDPVKLFTPGFTDRIQGNLGLVYGFQWRRCGDGARYENKDSNFKELEIDHLKDVQMQK